MKKITLPNLKFFRYETSDFDPFIILSTNLEILVLCSSIESSMMTDHLQYLPVMQQLRSLMIEMGMEDGILSMIADHARYLPWRLMLKSKQVNL
eukprot:TRINITY_DN9315_c0_g1_i1.p1 TRINITY_DN9315_c0_g1~~TRINITY_DN9315_c0_g1_i1.p1  ORF type:complete len:105 (-),score=20.90 TRINITY_DN9315_c0_g1_i1:394-675(-)